MSDILIRGMEMPKGGYRTVEIGFDADGHPMALADGGDVFDVIPIPPHGRLIDADANLAVMMRVLDVPYTDHGKIDTAMLKACIKMFEEAPTIIPAEEVE